MLPFTPSPHHPKSAVLNCWNGVLLCDAPTAAAACLAVIASAATFFSPFFSCTSLATCVWAVASC